MPPRRHAPRPLWRRNADALAGARRAEKVLGLLRERRAAAERRDALRRSQARLEDALERE